MSQTISKRAEAREPATVPKTASNLQSELRDKLPALPDEPLVVIRSGKSWAPINLQDVWVYRELLYFLVWRELKVRYKQTVLGVAWVILQPLLMTLIFTVFLGKLARVPSGRIPYPIFVYSGLTAWTFISTAVLTCAGSLVGNVNLVTKVYCPRIIVPTATILARLVDFVMAFVILVALMLYYHAVPTRALLMLPVAIALMILLSWALGVWMSALNVRYRDITIMLPVATQLGMFLSPVVYSASIIPAKWQKIYGLNPMVGIIQNFRSSLFNEPFDWWSLGVSTIATVVLVVVAVLVFSRTEKGFADII
jgi:lipopolysaccharide transport system permease protein